MLSDFAMACMAISAIVNLIAVWYARNVIEDAVALKYMIAKDQPIPARPIPTETGPSGYVPPYPWPEDAPPYPSPAPVSEKVELAEGREKLEELGYLVVNGRIYRNPNL